MQSELLQANYIVAVVGIGYCAIILTILLFRKNQEPVYSQPTRQKNVFQRAVSGIMKERIKPIRFTDDRLWEMDQDDRRNKPR